LFRQIAQLALGIIAIVLAIVNIVLDTVGNGYSFSLVASGVWTGVMVRFYCLIKRFENCRYTMVCCKGRMVCCKGRSVKISIKFTTKFVRNFSQRNDDKRGIILPILVRKHLFPNFNQGPTLSHVPTACFSPVI